MMSSSSSPVVACSPGSLLVYDIHTLFLGAETNINIDGRCVVVMRRSTIIIKMCSQMFGNKMRRLPADNGERRCCANSYEVAERPKK